MKKKNNDIGSYKTRIATAEEFHSARDAWNRLVFSMAQPSVFLTWEWLYTWWECFSRPERELLLLFVERDGELKGILPLFREGGYRGMGANFIWFCGANDLYPDHLDIIAAPNDAAPCLASIFRFFLTQYSPWAVIEFPMVTLDSSIYGWLCGLTAEPNAPRVEVIRASVAYYIALEGNFESYFASLDKKQRYNVRTRRNRLYAEHGVRYSGRPGTTDSFDALFDLHRRRSNRKGIVSSFDEERVLGFHHAFIKRADPLGWVNFRFLESPAGPIAGGYNLVLAGRVFSYQKGIDPAWEHHGPGTVLLYELVQEAFSQGLKEYNFLQGGETYKSEWTPNLRNLYTLKLYSQGMAGRAVAYMRSSRRLLKRFALIK